MTAIDPVRLEREVDQVAEALPRVDLFRQKCLDLLMFYADRTRRPVSGIAEVEKRKILGVPKPVVRSLSQALCRAGKAHPDSALPAAGALWSAGYRETRLLAASLLGVLTDEMIAEWAQEHVPKCRDFASLQALAWEGLQAWREHAPQAFLERNAEWLGGADRRLRAFSLLALTALVETPGFEDLPTVFRMTAGQARKARDEVRQALQLLIDALARRSAPETAYFLLDELAYSGAEARWLVRRVLDSFPQRQRGVLREGLSELERTDTIPRIDSMT